MKLWAWGANSAGQLGLGFSSDQVSIPTEVPCDQMFAGDHDEANTQIEGGGSHTIVFQTSEQSYSTTLLGLISTKKPCPKTQVIVKPIFSSINTESISETLASGWDFALFLNAAGEVFSLGDHSYGQLGRRPEHETKFSSTWDKVPLQDKMVSISAGMRHCVAVDTKGSIYAWGDNSKGQTGLFCDSKVISDPTKAEESRIPIPSLIKCSKMNTIFISESGHFYGTGLNKFGILGTQAERKEAIVPEFIKLFSDEEIHEFFPSGSVVDFQCGWNHVLVLMKDGRVISWGRNNFGQLGRPFKSEFADVDYDMQPNYVKGLPEPILAISCGSEHNLVLGESGQVYCWGWNEHDNCGVKNVVTLPGVSSDDYGVNDVIHCPTKVPIPDTEKAIVIGCGAGNCFVVTTPRK